MHPLPPMIPTIRPHPSFILAKVVETFFAASAAPIVDWTRLPHVLLWIWFYVFQFDVSNQTLNPDEDALNKRDRPLPSGRITLRHAVVLRWILIPLCFALSGCYSIEAVYASIALVALTIVCDEMHAHAAHWIIRNSVNALGFASFEVGATLVGGVNSHALDCTGVLAVCVSTGIFATTIRAQDFKDEDGDRAVGRCTVPIVFPTCGRWTVIVPLIAWSSCLGVVWELDGMTAIAFMTLALYVGGQFVSLSAVSDDQVSFYWYNAWLSAAHALPGYYRIWGKV
ncbi:UbiA prenyltransferase family [Amylostereum chailletii]|nr:UbiA prenyltransferase family [Amylostereum chailletii]